MVRRPLFYITFSFAVSIATSYYLGTVFSGIAALIIVASILSVKKCGVKVGASVVLLSVSYLSGTAAFCFHNMSDDMMESQIGKQSEISGCVLQIDRNIRDDGSVKNSVKIRVSEINGRSAEKEQTVLIDYYGSERDEDRDVSAIPGDVISASGVMEIPSGRRNPGCFDYALYLRSVGVTYIFKAESVRVTEYKGARTLSGRMHMIKTLFLKRLESAAGKETAAMMGAVLLGEKEGMDQEILEEFQKNGTAHVLAVSGLHIGIMYGFISLIWRWRKGRFYFVIVIMFFLCYSAMSAFAPSVVRAVLMVGIHLLSKMMNKRYDMNSAAFSAALAMLVKNPMSLFNTGFQMSFLAVLTMALMISLVKKVYSGIFLSSIAVQLGLAPYTAYVFNYISLSAVFVNVPIIFLTGIIVPVGLCSVAVMNISNIVFEVSARLMSGLCSMLISLNHMTAVDGETVFSVISPDIRFLAVYYLSLALFLSEEGRLVIMRRRKKLIFVMIAAVILAAGILGQLSDRGFRNADMVFVDVGQGDCVHFRTKDGGNYLIDGGGSINYNIGKKILKPYLLKNGVKKLDGIFVTHLHADHYKGAAELCREGMADRLFLYEANSLDEDKILRETGLKKDAITYLYGGQNVSLSQEDAVEVLWPEKKSKKEYEADLKNKEDENLSSLVFKITVREAGVLMTGDIDEACQKKIEALWGSKLKCSVLKVPHHGSKYSYCDKFIKRAKPLYSVFQVGKNNFGHPDKGVVENYQGQGIIVYRNDNDGAIAFEFLPDGRAEVKTMIKGR